MIKNIIIFASGVATGAAAMYFYLESKYDKRLEEEIESVKDHEEDRIEKEVEKRIFEESMKKNKEKPDLNQIAKEAKEKYRDVLQKTNYQSFASKQAPVEKSSGDPYIISAETYSDDDTVNYEKNVLMYYDEDCVLATEAEELVDVSDTVGVKNLNAFGDTIEEAMYVRNDRTGNDYEVIRINSSYSMLTGSIPEED